MSEPLAEARVLIVPDLTGFRAALAAEVTKATAVAVPAATSAATATRSVAAAQLEGAKAARLNAAANLEVANVFGAVAASARLEQKALLETAAAHEAASRGALTTILSFFGLRGATLAASEGFIIGAAASIAAKKSIEEYSSEAEAAARVTAILGPELGKSAEEWGKQQAAIGLSAEAALKYAGAIAQVFKNVKIAADENAKFSEALVTRAVDVAARSNVPVTQVLRAFQLALSGNLRGLRQYVPAVDAAVIANRALRDTGKETKASLTTQELVLARYEVIMDKSANQAGTFAERQNNLAAQSKILRSNIANLAATLGGPFAHALAGDLIGVNKLFEGLHKLSSIHVGGLSLLNIIFPPTVIPKLIDQLGGAKDAIDQLPQGLQGITGAAAGAAGGLNSAGGAAANMVGPLNAAASAVYALRAALAGLGAANTSLLRLQAEGAPLGSQLAGAQKALAAAEAASKAADALTPAKGKATAQKAALQAELQARQQEAGIQGQIDAKARAAAAAAKAGESAAAKAAREAQAALDAQDQKLHFEQQQAQGRVEFRKLRAQRTKSLADDISASEREVKLLTQQIIDAKKINDEQDRLNTLQQLRAQKEQAQQDIIAKEQERRDRRRQRIVDAADSKVRLAELDAQIAEVRGNKKAQIAALLRANVELERERKAWIGNTQKQKEITLAIAENTKQIKDLQKAKATNTGASAAFLFLQSQQGFAANVLSNLLPASAVAGSVGGTSGAISPTIPSADFATAVHQRPGIGSDVSSSAQISAGAKGASSGQMNRLIHIQEQMLWLARGGHQRTSHPEAARAWAYSATEMLNTGW